MSEFEQATAIRVSDETPNVFTANVPDLWQQGKGAFGGISVGILTRAIVATESDRTRALRSLTADLCAPVLPGAVEVEVSSLRRGGSISFIDARLSQNGGLVARASAALASPRAVTPAAIRPVSPKRPPWRDVPPIPVAPPIGPVFAEKYEYRSTGPLPFAGGTDAAAEGWLREKVTPSVIDEAAIAGLLDAWWPSVFAIESGPRGVATVGYTMQMLVDPRTLDPGEPLFYRGRGVAAGGSLFIEMRELWSGDTVVAMNQQTFALLA
ncbi:MAG: TesB-like acyl-CoA thioesterase 1 [Labilithrix sp.]|nr:TesB-like acyl-CoA thioesterase 1 [Labilithrix sp.]